MRCQTVVLSLIAALGFPQRPMHPALRTEYCTVVENPGDFNGKIVVFRARLTGLKSGQWGLDSECMRPMLLMFPRDIVPRPEFDVQTTPALDMMLKAQHEQRVLFRADFVGRFDWTGSASQPGGNRTRMTFGKSQLTMRLVLHDVLEPERIVIPRK